MAGTDPTGYLPCKDGVGDQCEIPTPTNEEKRENTRERGGRSRHGWRTTFARNNGTQQSSAFTVNEQEDTSDIGNYLNQQNSDDSEGKFRFAMFGGALTGLEHLGDSGQVIVAQMNGGVIMGLLNGKIDPKYTQLLLASKDKLGMNHTMVLDFSKFNEAIRLADIGKGVLFAEIGTGLYDTANNKSLSNGEKWVIGSIDTGVIISSSRFGWPGAAAGLAWELAGGSEGIRDKYNFTRDVTIELNNMVRSDMKKSIQDDVLRPWITPPNKENKKKNTMMNQIFFGGDDG